MSDGLRTTLQELARHWRDMHKIPHSAYRQACQCADQLQAALAIVEARAPQEPPPSPLEKMADALREKARQEKIRDCRHQYWDLGHCIDCYATQNQIDDLKRAAAEGRDTPLSCANCHHVEPHTASTAGGGPADPFDGCTHPGCDCGYDSRRYQFEAQIVAAGRDTPPPITITGRTAQSYILEAEARDTPPPIPVSDDNTANKQFQVGGDTPQEPPRQDCVECEVLKLRLQAAEESVENCARRVRELAAAREARAVPQLVDMLKRHAELHRKSAKVDRMCAALTGAERWSRHQANGMDTTADLHERFAAELDKLAL